MPFIQIVRKIEQGLACISLVKEEYAIQSRSTIVLWLIKFGNFGWENKILSHIPKLPEQKLWD